MSTWKATLSQSGYRITRPRRVVMQVLKDSETPLSPQEVLGQGQVLYPGLSLVSVYRSLELFEQFDLVSRVHLQETCQGYVAQQPGHRHQILCRTCGRAVEFQGCDQLAGLIRYVEACTGYRVEAHLLQLSGLCPACRDMQE